MLELILKISLAHLLGDFVFQSNKMVRNIDTYRLRSSSLYLHVFIHFVLLLIVTSFEKKYLFPVFLLALSHLFIDIFTKIFFKNSVKNIRNLILDQMLHGLTIAAFVYYFHPFSIDYTLLFHNQSYLLVIALISITYVSAIIIKKIMESFQYTLPKDGLHDAGKYIGMLERLFIFVFIVTSFWEGIGFLLAAKSIFRFGDLKENKEIRLTEYILIGTLLSFGLAMVIGMLYVFLKNGIG